jgi:uroporphyrinogen III methyltransferase/synthase
MTCPAIRIEPVPFETPENATLDSQRKPCAEIQPADYDPLSRTLICLAREAKPGWIVFTSANGVEQTWLRLRQLGLDARIFAGLRLAVIGQKTGNALERCGLSADLIAEQPSSAGLLEAFRSVCTEDAQPKSLMIFRSSMADAVLPQGLREMGYLVDDFVAYETCIPERPNTHLQGWLGNGQLDAILFFSGSSVNGFRAMAGKALDSALSSPPSPRFVAIGASAERALQQANLPCNITLPVPNCPDILRGLRSIL